MKELIKVTTNEQGQKLVSAKELFLGLGMDSKKWSRWRETNIENNDFFYKNIDWIAFPIMVNGNKSTDYAISLEMAKHLSMMCRTEKSHEYRQYFIECEKQLKENITSSYLISDPIERAKAWIKEQEEKQKLELELKEQAPKVVFANAVATSKTSILIGELAKLIKQNGVDTGQKRLFDWLRDNGYLIKRKGTDYNMPTQYSMELGLFEIKETSICHSDGHTSISKTPKVTGKGQQYFINKFLQN